MNRFRHSTDPKFFDHQRQQWSAPPIDGVGYIPSADLLKKTDQELRAIIEALEKERYNVNGWRNHKNLWREKLGLDTTSFCNVLDYGCGVGIEALQFLKKGMNTVYVADIVDTNWRLAMRVAQIHNLDHALGPVPLLHADGPLPMLPPLHVFYCAGVLHHIPEARTVLLRAAHALAPDGEIRLMLYSDIGWKISTETTVAPPVEEDVETNPLFRKFTSTFDSVGAYADWYSADKLVHRFGDFLDLVSYDYICSDDAYCVAILKKKVK